jgi:hypothetical protein
MTDVVVIGAGPYGLSVAANLLRTGLRVRVFGRHMEAWRDHMPEGMVLKSDGFATNFGALPLTLEKFCHGKGRPFKRVGYRTPLNDLIAYADAVREAYVGRLEDVRVTRLDRRSDGFAISLDNGDDVFAKRVVCAIGLTGFQRMPVITGMPEYRMTHVSAHHRLGAFAGQRVLTIGGGQSAFETSALLHENGAAVTVLTRRPPVWFDPEGEAVPSWWTRVRHPNFGLGPGWRAWLWSESPNLFYYLPRHTRLANAYATFGPAGSGWLKHRVTGRVPVITGSVRNAKDTSNGVQVTAEVDGQVRTFEVDHVIAATGYSSDLRKVPFLKPVLAAISCLRPGLPELDRSFQTSLPRLHVVGNLSAASLGPSMRFIYGTNRAAPKLARALKQEAPRIFAGFPKARKRTVS